MPPESSIIATCRCGRVKFRAVGEPIVSVVCYCDDCTAGARLIDALPGGASGMEADGGTPTILFRKDKVQCFEGQDLLRTYNVRPDTATDRVVASCCNTGMGSLFRSWLPHSNLRLHAVKDNPYPPTVRIMTSFAEDASRVPTDLPVHEKMPVAVILRLLGDVVRLWMASRNADRSWHDHPQRFEAGHRLS